MSESNVIATIRASELKGAHIGKVVRSLTYRHVDSVDEPVVQVYKVETFEYLRDGSIWMNGVMWLRPDTVLELA